MVLYPVPRVNVPVYCPSDFTTVNQSSLYQQLYISAQNVTSGLADISAKLQIATNLSQTSLATATIPALGVLQVSTPTNFYCFCFQFVFPANTMLAVGFMNGYTISGINPVNPVSPYSGCVSGIAPATGNLYIYSEIATTLGTAAGAVANVNNVQAINIK